MLAYFYCKKIRGYVGHLTEKRKVGSSRPHLGLRQLLPPNSSYGDGWVGKTGISVEVESLSERTTGGTDTYVTG